MKCKSIPELKRFLSIQEQALGEHSPEVATTVSRLADMYLQQGLLDDAEALYRRALEIRERVAPFRRELEDSRKSLNKVLALKNVDNSAARESGAASRTKGSNMEAWWSAQAGRSRHNSHNGRVKTESYQDTSTALDQVPPSMFLTQDAVALSESINELRLEADLIRQVSGNKDPSLADCLTKLADLYCRSKRYIDMEPLLQEALSIREERYGSCHQLVATGLKNLARLYYFQGKYHRALPLFERALDIRRRVFGERHAKVADILEHYAKLLRKTGLVDDAVEMMDEVSQIRGSSGTWNPL